MNGIHRVLPNEAAQPEFKKALVEAAKAGVQVVCYSCHVEADCVKITGVIEDTSKFVICREMKVKKMGGERIIGKVVVNFMCFGFMLLCDLLIPLCLWKNDWKPKLKKQK